MRAQRLEAMKQDHKKRQEYIANGIVKKTCVHGVALIDFNFF